MNFKEMNERRGNLNDLIFSAGYVRVVRSERSVEFSGHQAISLKQYRESVTC
jgi:hypothetical protein